MYLGSLPAVSNKEDWVQALQLVDANTGDVIDIQSCSITMTLRDFKTKCNRFSGSTSGGVIVINTDNTFTWSFPWAIMSGLCEGQYEVGLRIAQGARVAQLLICSIEVFEGIDAQ